ncbi:MAG: glycosyltransferase, partial [Candidatus Eremiobacteraeota bacterium]|nr:glycosyltransferase [Candidatus Eremiobacteraeota bacterium]
MTDDRPGEREATAEGAEASARAGRALDERARVTVVIATRNRVHSLLRTLDCLTSLCPGTPIVVADNGSDDTTSPEVRARFPSTDLLALDQNFGAAARTVAAERCLTPYVAFCDDDSWWSAGSLTVAVRTLDANPRLALVTGRVLVGQEERLDPTCAEMAASPLQANACLPGPPVLGFLAAGSVVRRSAFLAAGGFNPRYGIGGEEELLAIDLAAAGWDLAYVASLIAHHYPCNAARDADGRRRLTLRNGLWTAGLR